jgi:transposase
VLSVEGIQMSDAAIELHVIATQPNATCPECAQPTSAVHSRYTRRLADLPWAGVAVVMRLQVRKFFCRNVACPRAIFTERLPEIALPHHRQTQRLWEQQRQLALAHGGEAGARTAERHGLPASAKTLLRRICHTPLDATSTPRILGVDDWALRKGQTYGTILVDLERHRPVDLLPDRTAATLAAWLQAHPGVQIITRDRAGDYADGATRGAPAAVQVADRFHLVQNAHQALVRLLERHSNRVREAARIVNERHTTSHTQAAAIQETSPSCPAAPDTPDAVSPAERPLTQYQQHQQARRARRYALYCEVQRLRAAGTSIRQIVKQLHLHRTTVRRFLAEQFPEQAARPRRASILDPHLPYLETQLRAGHDNAMQLWRDLRDDQGYRGSRALVSRWVADHRALCPPQIATRPRRGSPPKSPTPALPPRFKTPSIRATAWLLVTDPDSWDDDQAQFVAQLGTLCPELQTGHCLTGEFLRLVRERDLQALDEWFGTVATSKVPELMSFAAGLRRDEAAVRAALRLPHSNGQVEGQINKLKLLKRSMYGQARFDLLKRRLLAA